MNGTGSILLVDDDPLVLSGFKEVLEREGYQITAVSSGREALEKLDARPYDVVLTDLVMPRVGGLEILRSAQAKYPDSIVIVVTAFASVRSAVDALRLGAHDYLIKPCEELELLFRVRMGIEHAALRAELHAKEIDAEKMKAIAQTAVTVNDQINTPLNVILNSAEYIRLKTLPDTQGVQQSLDFINQEVTKIKSVIQRLARIADPKIKEYAGGSVFMVDVEQSGQQSPNGSMNGSGKRRILVVDDEQFMVHTLSKILELMGFDVVSAFGGKQAFDLFLSQKIDLVVSDLHMPDMNGVELLTSIKSRNPEMPVILVTGYGVDKARESAGKWKADGFLGKPFKVNELKSLIQQALSAAESTTSSVSGMMSIRESSRGIS
jgi:DNA-binding NtrC family response regulator